MSFNLPPAPSPAPASGPVHQLRLLLVALQFLTRVPVPAWVGVGFQAAWLNTCVRYFPLVGALVGGVGAAVLWAALALWPDLGATPRQRIAAGLEANRAYLDAVLARQPAPVLRQLQRQAGLASIDAETALHELGGLRRQRDGLTSEEVASLRSLRELAGQASVQWHRQHADGRSS